MYCRNSLIEGENGIGRDPGALRPLRGSLRIAAGNDFLGALFGCTVWLPAARMVATAAAIVPAIVAARGARLQTKAQQGRRIDDIARLLPNSYVGLQM